MGEHTTITWCDHTFNPWWGCTKLTPACDNCYAELWARRFGVTWGDDAERRPASERTWGEPTRWNARAAAAGRMASVFCLSMGDIFEARAPRASQARLWSVARETDHLLWLFLTKRPHRATACLPPDLIGDPRIWVGCTVEDQERADLRRPAMAELAALGVPTFVSYEPALGPVDWSGWEFIRILFSGGESGPKARPSHPDWHRGARDFCATHGIAYHFKQWGEWAPITIAEDENGDFDAAYPMEGCSDWEAHKDGQECLFWQGDRLVHWPLIETREAIGVRRVGKRAAGRSLDGRTHDDMPEVRA